MHAIVSFSSLLTLLPSLTPCSKTDGKNKQSFLCSEVLARTENGKERRRKEKREEERRREEKREEETVRKPGDSIVKTVDGHLPFNTRRPRLAAVVGIIRETPSRQAKFLLFPSLYIHLNLLFFSLGH